MVGAVFNYKKDKNIINFGTKVADVSYTQTNEFAGNSFKRHFINWLPQARYQYKFSQQGSLNINYQGNTTQPTINQLQPVADNTDNLNVSIGNPNLKPSFSNNISLSYYSYKVLSDQFINLYSSYSFTTNPIVSNTSTDITTGKTVYQSVNIGKVQTNYNGGIWYNRKVNIGKTDFSAGFNLGMNGNTSYNYTNGALNTTDSYSYYGALQIQKYVVKKYGFNLSIGPTYTIAKSSLQANINNNGFGYNGRAGFNVFLPFKFQFSSDIDDQFTGKTQSFDQNFSKVILNSSLARTFFKDESLRFAISGNDLLNQNVGFSRSAYGNTITQNSYTTIKRYFMLTISWDFNHMGGSVTKK